MPVTRSFLQPPKLNLKSIGGSRVLLGIYPLHAVSHGVSKVPRSRASVCCIHLDLGQIPLTRKVEPFLAFSFSHLDHLLVLVCSCMLRSCPTPVEDGCRCVNTYACRLRRGNLSLKSVPYPILSTSGATFSETFDCYALVNLGTSPDGR